MNFILQRISDNGDSTMGLLYHKETKEFFAFTLEDEHRDQKVKGETRIPTGLYELKILKKDTPLTLKHRETYGAWFKYHIEITNVQGFSGIYIHAGNDDDHTDGCLLLGNTLTSHYVQHKNPLASSTAAVRRFYELCYPHLDKGFKAFLEVRNEGVLGI